MPAFTLRHPDENATHDQVVAVVHDYDSEIKILDGGIGAVDAEMTEAQAADFILINPNWNAKKIVYAEISPPGLNLQDIRRFLADPKNQPQ